jgi:adenosylmethionine-8-amino-7-oxononanoate aminotransferase
VLLRPLGNVIYVLPPYCIGRKDLDYVYDVIQEALEVI